MKGKKSGLGKRFRKGLSLLLTLSLLAGMIPDAAFAQDETNAVAAEAGTEAAVGETETTATEAQPATEAVTTETTVTEASETDAPETAVETGIEAGTEAGTEETSGETESETAQETEMLAEAKTESETDAALLGSTAASLCDHGNDAYTCVICEVEALIDELPTIDEISAMDTDEQNEVYTQASDICDIYYDDLTEDEQGQVTNVDDLWEVLDYFSGAISLTASSVTYLDETGEEQTCSSYTSVTTQTTWKNAWYSLSTTATSTSAAGAYDITGTALDENYNITFVNEEDAYTITAAELTDVTVSQSGTLIYDGTAQTADVTTGAETADGTDADVTFTYSTSENGEYSTEVPAFTDAGIYTVYYRAEADNHGTVEGSFTITIAAKSVTASISGTTERNYDGTTDTTAEQRLSIELSGVVDGDTVTATAESYTYDSADVDLASTITAVGITLGGDDAGNYELTATTATIEGSITAKEITVSITPNGGTYAGTITAATATLDGVTDADEGSVDVTLTYTGTANDGTEYSNTEVPTLAGTYTVTATISDSNYSLIGTTAAEFVIAKATYDMSGVSFTDTTYRYDGTEKTLTISGTLPDGVTVSYENNTLTDAGSTVATATFTGDTDNYEAIEPMTATLTVAVLTDLPEQDFPDEGTEHKVEVQEGLSEVPEALQAIPELDTVEEIEAQLKTLVIGQIGYTEENTIIYDVTLMISFDGGLTWEKATAENFPEGGLTVILPYPEGTNKEDYDFTVIHMFTTSAFGKTPGDTEILDPIKTDDGLQVTLTGLSPIVVAWKAIAQSSGSGSSGGTQTESETTAQSEPETESETTAQSEPETESETTAQSESETESETTVQSELETESETAAQSESETESETATQSESETESEPETETETTAQTETETESETTAQSDTESETTVQSESETETETENSVQTGDDTPLGLWLTLFLMSAAVLLMTGERKRRRN